MPNSVEIAKYAVEQFQKVQRHMIIAKEEVAGVNLTDIDEIKE